MNNERSTYFFNFVVRPPEDMSPFQVGIILLPTDSWGESISDGEEYNPQRISCRKLANGSGQFWIGNFLGGARARSTAVRMERPHTARKMTFFLGKIFQSRGGIREKNVEGGWRRRGRAARKGFAHS